MVGVVVVVAVVVVAWPSAAVPTTLLRGGEEGCSRLHAHTFITPPLLLHVHAKVGLMGLGCAVEEHRFVEIHRWALWKKKRHRLVYTK